MPWRFKLKFSFCVYFFSMAAICQGQVHNLIGTVHNNKMEPIPFINVNVKELNRQSRTNEEGKFVLPLPPGRYQIIFTGVGYKKLESITIMPKEDFKKDFLLEQDQQQIQEVFISSKRKDRSREIIKQLIESKKEIQRSASTSNFDVYIKALVIQKKPKESKNKDKPERIKKADTLPPPPIEAQHQFAEVALNVSQAYPDKLKENRIGVNIKGNKEAFFFLSLTEGDFDFYENLIRVRKLGNVSFLSPFSISGLIAYRYNYVGLENINNKLYHHIKFKPSSMSNALLTGEVWIQDETWVIKKISTSFPNAHTPEYKEFEIEANYDNIQNKMWLPVTYAFRYVNREQETGKTLVDFKNYNLDTVFDKKYFNNELSATTSLAYKQDSSFWNKTRSTPLTQEEIKVIRIKDSIYELTHSDKYRDSVEQDVNKVRLINILWKGQALQNWRKERNIYLPSLVNMIQPLSIGGPRIGAFVNYQKKYENKKELRFYPSINYGPWNKDIRGQASAYYLYNPFTRSSIDMSLGRGVSNLFWNDAFVNLFDRSNYFLRENLTVGFRREIVNGLYVRNAIELGFRKSMHNYVISSFIDSVLFEREVRAPIFFPNYAAFFNELNISYTPQQKYIREPFQKLILGSKYPTFYAKWRKGIPGILNSIIKYDYIELGMEQEINMGTLGLTSYNLKYGNFVHEGNVEAADYKFIARGNPALFFNPINSFQAMDSTFALFKGFIEGHLVHDFNGAFLNKIPYMRKLKVFESAGTGVLYAPERNLLYAEAFVGVEKYFVLFRQPLKFGIWGVSSVANTFQNPFQIKFSIRVYDFQSDRWQ